MRYIKEWMIGCNKRDESCDDYISAYIAENGVRIECMHGFTNWSDRWYMVRKNSFETLKEAKQFVESMEETERGITMGRVMNKNEFETYIRSIAAGTIANIIGSTKYADIDRAHENTVEYVMNMDEKAFPMEVTMATVFDTFRCANS